MNADRKDSDGALQSFRARPGNRTQMGALGFSNLYEFRLDDSDPKFPMFTSTILVTFMVIV